MDSETKIKIEEYLRKQISNADTVASSYIHDQYGKEIPGRNIFVKLQSYVTKFLSGDKSMRWVVLTGLRGVGKTTALMHIYAKLPNDVTKLYISVDRITELFGVSFFEVLSIYEEMVGGSFEQLKRPLFLFVDEAQYDPKWGPTLKDVYDRAHNVFIFTTGSSALEFNMNNDIARRPVFEKMYPLTFTEYIKLKKISYEKKGLCKRLQETIMQSSSADEVYQGLRSLETEIKTYNAKVPPIEVKNYITSGSLPAVLSLTDDVKKFERVTQSLKKIVTDDITRLYDFDTETIRKIPMMLYNIAQADQVAYSSFDKDPISVNRHTAKEVIDALINTETILRIPAYTGSHAAQTRQPSKYVFPASAFRASFFQLTESVSSKDDVTGKLLEDIVALYLHKYLARFQSFISYDAENGGADFVIGIESKRIVIEVGSGEKDYRQVVQTAEKVKPAYSIVISRSALEYSKDANAVKIPIEYFLLM